MVILNSVCKRPADVNGGGHRPLLAPSKTDNIIMNGIQALTEYQDDVDGLEHTMNGLISLVVIILVGIAIVV